MYKIRDKIEAYKKNEQWLKDNNIAITLAHNEDCFIMCGGMAGLSDANGDEYTIKVLSFKDAPFDAMCEMVDIFTNLIEGAK